MKEIVILSGKGGTGKTSLTSAFASLARNSVFADCDVDAPDLHLVLRPKIKKTIGFHGMKVAKINKEKCIECKRCIEACKFGAINENLEIEKDECEGCGVCSYVCPANAIEMVDRISGFIYISETRFGPMVHAKLNPGEEASGKLVSQVKEKAREIAIDKDLLIVDGPPGIACPAIAALSGADLALMVAEPTLTGIHDLDRIVGVAEHFGIKHAVCINKSNLNLENADRIKDYCKEKGIEVVGEIPYDVNFVRAVIEGKTLLELDRTSKTSKLISKVWERLLQLITS